MSDDHYDVDDGEFMLIGLCAAALSGAIVGMVAGACGALLAVWTWNAFY